MSTSSPTTEAGPGPRAPRRPHYILIPSLVILALVSAGALYLHLRAASLASAMMSDALGVPASVAIVDLSAGTGLTLYGISVKNPPGFSSENLLKIKSLSIVPRYKELARGRLAAARIGVDAPEVWLEQDAAGAWNFQPVLDKLTSKEKTGREFSAGRISLGGGRVVLAGRDMEIEVEEFVVEEFSNAGPGPARFAFKAGDGKGVTVSGNGDAALFGGARVAHAQIRLRAGKFERYMKPPDMLDVSGAALDAAAAVALDGGMLDASVKGRLAGASYTIMGEKKKITPRFEVAARYDMDADELRVERADAYAGKFFEMDASGRVAGVKGRGDVELEVRVPDVVLSEFNEFLPENVKISGTARPGPLVVAGTLKPFRMAVDGAVGLEGVAVRSGGMRVDGIGGKADFSYVTGGAARAGFDISALGGKTSGSARYEGGSGGFRLDGAGLSLSGIGGPLEGVKGMVDFRADGVFGGDNDKVTADYEIKAANAGLPGRDAAVESASITGRAVLNKAGWAAGGKVEAANASYPGYALDDVSADYAYAGNRLSLTDIACRGMDFYVLADAAEAVMKDTVVQLRLTGAAGGYGRDVSVNGVGMSARYKSTKDKGPGDLHLTVEGGSGEAYGVHIDGLSAEGTLKDNRAGLAAEVRVAGNTARVRASADVSAADVSGGAALINPDLSGNLEIKELASISPLLNRFGLPVGFAEGTLVVSGSLKGRDLNSLKGSGSVKADGVGFDKDGDALLRGVSAEFAPAYGDGVLTIPESDIRFGESFVMRAGCRAVREDAGWSVTAGLKLPQTGLLNVQEGVLEALPPGMKWADVKGSAGLDAQVYADASGTRYFSGALDIKDAVFDLYDIGLQVGPVHGSVPLGFSMGGAAGGDRPSIFRDEEFERDAFGTLVEKYSGRPPDAGLFIDSIKYGFVEFKDIALSLRPGEGYYEVGWYGLRAFGAGAYGYGVADFTREKRRYALTLVMSDLSLAKVCGSVPSIEGYLSGRVDGLVRVLVAGETFGDITGAAMFWANDSPEEDQVISKAFLKKLMGSAAKSYITLGDRGFDKGELDVIIRGGYLVFDKLLIENTNFFGMRDLYVTVAPVSNKIAVEHLLEVIRDVGARAGGN